MHTPGFWRQGARSIWPDLLAPIAMLYDAAVQWTYRTTAQETAPMPVVCVGNFVAGGAGKTPTAIALSLLLAARGHKPGFLSRGYGGKLAGPVLVDRDMHAAGDVGDEPLLLARRAPTIVGTSRPAGARLAADHEIDVLIMDDGLQNNSLAKAFSLAVVDAAYGIGNGRPVPSGPLRGGMPFQLGLADAILVIGTGHSADDVKQMALNRGLPVFRAQLENGDLSEMKGADCIAYAGIGRPEKFFDSLRAAGVRLVSAVPFPDHHPFTQGEARRLLDQSRARNASLLTTEKDFSRLARATGDLALLAQASRAVPVQLIFDDAEALLALIEARISTQNQSARSAR